jgi:hypothetical protein
MVTYLSKNSKLCWRLPSLLRLSKQRLNKEKKVLSRVRRVKKVRRDSKLTSKICDV